MLNFAQNSQIDFSTGSQMPNTISNQTKGSEIQIAAEHKLRRELPKIYSTNTNPKVVAQTKQIPIIVAQIESN